MRMEKGGMKMAGQSTLRQLVVVYSPLLRLNSGNFLAESTMKKQKNDCIIAFILLIAVAPRVFFSLGVGDIKKFGGKRGW